MPGASPAFRWKGFSANERLQIGGAEYGRGFDNALLSFDRGFAVMVEPSFRPITSSAFAASEIYLFADYGDGLIAPGSTAARSFNLASAGIGTRIVYKEMASLGLEIADPLKLPADGVDDDPVITFSWSFRYQH